MSKYHFQQFHVSDKYCFSMFSWSPHVLQDVWATMLEDRGWLDNFLDTKLERMKANYDVTTSWLRSNNINFIEMYVALETVRTLPILIM